MENSVKSTKTTIVIPNYNGIKYLKDCLDSIKAAGNYPLIIVDNSSTDGSVEYIKTRMKDMPGINLVELSTNTGFCHASNVGLKLVSTEYAFLLNNDTTIEIDTITALEARMDSDKRIFSAQSRILTMLNHDLADDCGDLYCALGWAFGRAKNKPFERFLTPVDIFAGCGAAVMYRMSAFDLVGMFDEKHFAYLEDIDLGYRARIYGFRNVYEPTSVIYHAGSATSGSRYNEFKVDLSSRNSVYIVYKNMPIGQIIINLPFLIPGFAIKALFFARKGMGATYIRGLKKGFDLCKEDRLLRNKKEEYHKVPFKFYHMPAYVAIQLDLWANLVKRFTEG